MAYKTFADYKAEGHRWITLTTGDFYPDIIQDACTLYGPVLKFFGNLLYNSTDSEDLLMKISDVTDSWMRIQLARVFRKYVSPDTPVEMLKKKTHAAEICEQFGSRFRPLGEVIPAFNARPMPDEAICTVLWEYKGRGSKGYDLTEKFFEIIKRKFPAFRIDGPERAGKDIFLGEVFKDYPNAKRPVDFIIYDDSGARPLAVGLARYDSDRGGAQEDDRTGGYKNCADEVLGYCGRHGLSTKVIFLNDGPGLLLGSMWDDYADIESRWDGKIMVLTLRMVDERFTREWLERE
jgi:hypothetical protein